MHTTLGSFLSFQSSCPYPTSMVLLPVRNLLTEDGEIVCLIKPQFEAGREKVGKKGVVRDPKVHEEVIEKVRDYVLLFLPDVFSDEGDIQYFPQVP